MDLSNEEFDLLVGCYYSGTVIVKPITTRPSLTNPNLVKLIELKVITEDKTISSSGGFMYLVRKTPLISGFMKQFSLIDIISSCIKQDRISDACREIMFKATLGELPELLSNDNDIIRKVAKQRLDKLTR